MNTTISKDIFQIQKKILTILFITTFLITEVNASPFEYKTLSNGYRYVTHKHSEASYQEVWCRNNKGVTEYENKDYTRVDCLTDTHAVEFDFSNKWAECMGQALWYGKMTGKKPMCVLILDGTNWKKQLVYYNRVKELGKIYNFDTSYITDDYIQVKDGECSVSACKCHKRKMSK